MNIKDKEKEKYKILEQKPFKKKDKCFLKSEKEMEEIEALAKRIENKEDLEDAMEAAVICLKRYGKKRGW